MTTKPMTGGETKKARRSAAKKPTEKQVAERKAKVDEAVEVLETGVDELMQGAEFEAYLSLLAKVHDYSWGNVLLIMRQIPEPTLIMPFGDRKKTYGWTSVGRHVKKGEKGAMILRPVLIWVDDDDNPGKRKQIVSGFRPAYVYDVAQTEGDPIPEQPRAKELTGASNEAEGLTSLLFAFAEKLKWRVFDNATTQLEAFGKPTAKGVADYTSKQIFLRSGISRDQYAKTLLHELVHAYKHFDNRKYLTRATAELEAEGAAYVVSKFFGMDTSDYSFAYVAGWSGGNKDKFKEALKEIAKVSRYMIDTLINLGEESDDYAAE